MPEPKLRRVAVKWKPPRRDRRTLGERIALRFPRLARAQRAIAAGLPRSGLRRRLIIESSRVNVHSLNRGDLEAFVIPVGDDCEVLPALDAAGVPFGGDLQREYRGPVGYREMMDAWMEPWGEYRVTIEEMIEASRDRYAMVLRLTAEGRGSGVPIDQRLYSVCTLRRGSLVRSENHEDEQAALDALTRG